jgi:hypothetical protein
MKKQYNMLTWQPLQGGDEIRVGTAVFRLDTSVGTEPESAEPGDSPARGGT